MKMQFLLLLTLFFTITFATKINYFEARGEVPPLVNHTTIYANQIQLWVNVTECPQDNCSCTIKSNASNINTYNVNFMAPAMKEIGNAVVAYLQPNTMYSFILNCFEANNPEIRFIQTDVGRPSPPLNITITKNKNRLTLSWLPPLSPDGPIKQYNLTINNVAVADTLSNTTTSYEMKADYDASIAYNFVLLACNFNLQEYFICSNATAGSVNLPISSTIATTTVTPTPKPSSSIMLSGSIFLQTFIVITYSLT